MASFSSIDLSKYVKIGRYDLPEPTRTSLPLGTAAWNLLAQEASAITYNKDTDTLFVLGDGGTAIVQVSKTGALIDTMTLAKGSSPQGTDFYDPEGLAYVGNGKFVFVEERDQQVVEFTYTANTTLTRAATKTVVVGKTVGNIGLEGVTFDPSSSNAYILVKETGPLDIFLTSIDFSKVPAGTISKDVAGVASNGSSTRVDGTNQLFLPSKAGIADFADVYALSNVTALAGTSYASDLLILSQESGKVVEIGRDGTVKSSLTLLLDAGSKNSIPDQSHEGITMDAAGNIYIVSENGGGDVNHPQMWVYAASTATNIAPTSLVLNNQVTSILENIPITAPYKLADIAIVDDGLGTNALTLSGADSANFQVDASGLYLKTGTVLDFEIKKTYDVTVNVDDATVGGTPDAFKAFSLTLVDVVNENAPLPALAITEASPWSSGNSLYKADWIEITNIGSTSVDLTGLRFDDDSNAFGNSVALQGVSSLAPGKSAVYIEAVDSEASTISALTSAFKADWFGTNVPSGFQIGTYTGAGVGLSTGGDAVNLFDQFGRLITGIKLPASTTYQTFSNGAGAGSTSNPPTVTISTLSSLGANSFASAVPAVPAVAAVGSTPEVKEIKEIGSPGQATLSVKFSGIASGSATANSGIFWTRTWRADSTELLGAAADLTLEVSEKADFSVIAFSKTTNTAASSDYTTKVDLSGLSAGTSYYYRFKTTDGASISDVGQFKTVPAPTSTGTIRFGHGGDIDGLMAPYLSTQDLKTQKLDFFIFNGDTIYETAATGSLATAATKDVEAETKNADGSLKATADTLLADYRRKYLETHMGVTATTGVPTSAPGYYQGLDTFFAAQGLYVSLDNHELGNKDIINGGAPLALRTAGFNGSTNTADDVNTTGTYIHDSTSFKTLEQAFLEYQPIRQTVLSTPTDKRTDGTVQLYGAQQWGKNVVEINLDSRTYRDVRLNKIDPVLGRIDDTGSRADNPDRTLLGATQLAWLKKTLLDAKTAGTVWKFINTSDPIDQIGAVGSGDDGGKSWMGGYRAERNDLLKFIADNGITNVVFLASDDHQGRINEVSYVADPTQPTVYTKVPGVISIVDGAIGATGPDTVTDHSYTNIKSLADALASKQTTNDVDPIGLDPNFAGLFSVRREGDTTATTAPKAVDFYSPDTYNYALLEVSPEGILNVALRGIDSYAKNSFPTPSASNQPREILGFSIDGNHFVSGTSGNDTNIPTTPGTSTIPLFSGRTQTLTTGSGSDEIDVAILNGHDNSIFTGSGDDVIYAGTRDVITGGTGDDHLWATGGDGNRLDGGLGNDDFIIGTANNRVLGGSGNDVIKILGAAGSNYLNGGAGSDQFWLISGPNEKPAAKQYVMDFNAAEDKIGLRGATFADLSFTQVGGDTLLSVTGTAVGHFMNVNTSTLNNPSNFLFG